VRYLIICLLRRNSDAVSPGRADSIVWCIKNLFAKTDSEIAKASLQALGITSQKPSSKLLNTFHNINL
jgi:hypothetical protein